MRHLKDIGNKKSLQFSVVEMLCSLTVFLVVSSCFIFNFKKPQTSKYVDYNRRINSILENYISKSSNLVNVSFCKIKDSYEVNIYTKKDSFEFIIEGDHIKINGAKCDKNALFVFCPLCFGGYMTEILFFNQDDQELLELNLPICLEEEHIEVDAGMVFKE